MNKNYISLEVALAFILFTGAPAVASDNPELKYTYPVDQLKIGQSYGNSFVYVTLDGNTDILSDRSSVRFGLREATDQKYYMLGWNVGLKSGGEVLAPTTTSFTPAFQESLLRRGDLAVQKRFFVPFENNYLRSAHFLLASLIPAKERLLILSRAFFPGVVKVKQADFNGHRYVTVHYPDGALAIIWGSGSLQSLTWGPASAENAKQGDSNASDCANANPQNDIEVVTDYVWNPTTSEREFALSFAYLPGGAENNVGTLLNALLEMDRKDVASPSSHLARVHVLLLDTEAAIKRYLRTARLWTPDPLIDRGVQWAKVNMLRVQKEYKWGSGFTNNPPGDIVVGRDSAWFLFGNNYFAQPWSRRLLALWLRAGMEVSGKFTEYFTASGDPIFRDDYGLNINDNTPLLILAAHHYYSLTGDTGFLNDVYPALLNSANYILAQREIGEKDHDGLVWCDSVETSVRGICGWRNIISGYNLAGAVTEINAECYRALAATADLANAMGDEANQARLEAAAGELRDAIQKHLSSHSTSNPFYHLNIGPGGQPVDDMTADLVYPVLFGASDPAASQAILQELFSSHLWVSAGDGAGGLRTVSSAQGGKWGYRPEASQGDYGLLGGIWPNLALWAARAAFAEDQPDLGLKALRATFLLSERQNPGRHNFVPGEFPEYFSADNLLQRGMPLSPFVPPIFVWSALEGLLGVTPHASGLKVNPVLPGGWDWVAASRLPYRGQSISILAVRDDHTLYTTAPVETDWKSVVAPEALQQRYRFHPHGKAFWLVVPGREGLVVIAASSIETSGKLVDRGTGEALLELSIPAGKLVCKKLP